eukprot:361135-Chlamydomonas_euryale.AAC.1
MQSIPRARMHVRHTRTRTHKRASAQTHRRARGEAVHMHARMSRAQGAACVLAGPPACSPAAAAHP